MSDGDLSLREDSPGARSREDRGLDPLRRWIVRGFLARLAGPARRPGAAGGGSRRQVRLHAFGIEVEDPGCRERIERILAAFFLGVERGAVEPAAALRGGEALDPLERPFYFEGSAMGRGLRALLGLGGFPAAVRRHEESVGDEDPCLFLHYVGLGFWAGFLHGRRPGRLERLAASLGRRRLRHLLHDGFGFQRGFFRLPRDPGALEPLRRLEGFGREAAFNGLGRSLWFFAMDRPPAGFERARALDEDAEAALGGMGLAAAFTWPDDLGRAYAAAGLLAGGERAHFDKGIRIALYVRHRVDPVHLEACLGALPGSLGGRARDDLERALRGGEETQASGEFIQRFHAACLVP